MLNQRPELRVVGLTSSRNREFVAKLGCYHDVLTYDDVAELPETEAIYVDVAGDLDLRVAVHRRLASRLEHSLVVGATHWDHKAAADSELVGPEPVFFFAPNEISKRVTDWGQAEVDRRVSEAWHAFSVWTDGWLELEHSSGPDAVEVTYHEVVNGRSEPRVGHVCAVDNRRHQPNPSASETVASRDMRRPSSRRSRGRSMPNASGKRADALIGCSRSVAAYPWPEPPKLGRFRSSHCGDT